MQIYFRTTYQNAVQHATLKVPHLDLRSSDPAHGWQLILQQKVVGFIVEAPLTDGQVSPVAFHLKDINRNLARC